MPKEERVILNKKPPKIKLSKKEKQASRDLAKYLEAKERTEKELYSHFYHIIEKHDLKPKDFFKLIYNNN